jgi:hypothetical protein
MSDGHSDSINYSRFYRADIEARREREQQKLEKMCLVLGDNTIVDLDDIQLLFSEKYEKDTKKSSDEMLSEKGSRVFNLSELIRELIRKGVV